MSVDLRVGEIYTERGREKGREGETQREETNATCDKQFEGARASYQGACY